MSYTPFEFLQSTKPSNNCDAKEWGVGEEMKLDSTAPTCRGTINDGVKKQ